jgi:Ca2+:H+ antiporter
MVTLTSSLVLNLFIVFLPISWALHFQERDRHNLIFACKFSHSRRFCSLSHKDHGGSFLAIVPLERLFDYCGEQMAFYCGKDLSDLIVITLNKYVTLLV